MKIIYIHHAERDINSNVFPQKQDITNEGIIQAEMVGKTLLECEGKIKEIITSPHKRCVHTANIINEKLKVDIKLEEDFCEKRKEETWKEFQIRDIKTIDSIVSKSENNDIIVCVSSGLNISPFVFHNLGIKPDEKNNWIQHYLSAPIIFTYEK